MLRSGVGKKVHPTSSPSHLVEHSPFLKTLTGAGSSVTADLGMVQNDSLESVICFRLHVSCCQVIVSSAFIPLTFLIDTTLIVLMRRDDRCKCWVGEFRCLGFEIWTMRVSSCFLLSDLSLGCPVILSKIQFKKQLIHVGTVR